MLTSKKRVLTFGEGSRRASQPCDPPLPIVDDDISYCPANYGFAIDAKAFVFLWYQAAFAMTPCGSRMNFIAAPLSKSA